jgi:hypothetical protein
MPWEIQSMAEATAAVEMAAAMGEGIEPGAASSINIFASLICGKSHHWIHSRLIVRLE